MMRLCSTRLGRLARTAERRACRKFFPMFLLALALSVIVTPDVSARRRICRGDPIVWLSNGERVKMTVSIGADAEQVAAVVYTLHAPKGVTIDKIVYNGNPELRVKESVIFKADRPANSYVTKTLVKMRDLRAAPVEVTAMSMVKNANQEAVGLSGQQLTMMFTTSK